MKYIIAIWKWITKPTMNKLLTLLLIAFVGLFLYSFFETTGELSYFPAAWLCSAGIVGLLYLIDRVGFAKINTIEILKKNPELYYESVLPMYAICIVIGHIIALLIAIN